MNSDQYDGPVAIRSKRILTMDDAGTELSGTVLVDGGDIVAVLRAEQPVPDGYRLLEVGERPVLPGFVDPHVHLAMGANSLWGAVDCHTPPCSTIDDVVEALRARAELRDLRGGWLLGQGGLFADRRFKDGRIPDRHDLDRVSTEFPIAVRFGGHVTVVNSKALELAIAAGVQTKGDAYVAVGADGRPTGVLNELFYALPIPALTEAQHMDALSEVANEHLLSRGVTSVGEISDSVAALGRMADLAGGPRLPIRTSVFVWAPGTMTLDRVLDPGERATLPTSSSDRFSVRGIKIFVDGGISSAGAAVVRPYRELREGRPHRGRLAYSKEQLVDLVRRADEENLQIAAHVAGERAQHLVCEAAIAARGASGAGGPRVRLEHAGNIQADVSTTELWARAGIIPVPQAAMLWTIGPFISAYTGDYVEPGLFPFRRLLDDGWDLCSSSDGSGSEPRHYNPLFGVECAVTRMTTIGEPLNPDQAVSVTEALRMHTSAAARALGVDARVGSLEPGKAADVVVLDSDPRDVDPHKISAVDAEYVFIEGRLVKGELPANQCG